MIIYAKDIDYYSSDTAFQTLYLLHGSYGDCNDWSLFTGIERYAQEKCLAVIMPSAENSCYLNMEHGENYLNYVGLELPEFMNIMFPLSKHRKDTFIAGLSMGGYGAFKIALKFPEKFSHAASLSGAFDIGHSSLQKEAHFQMMDQNYYKAIFKGPSNIVGTDDDIYHFLQKRADSDSRLPELYMSCGTEDFLFSANEKLYKLADEKNLKVKFEKFSGKHDWDYWDSHIKDVLNWLPLANAPIKL